MLRECSVCKIEKDISEFHKNASRKDGRRKECRACVAIYDRNRRFTKRVEISKQRKEFREANKDRLYAIRRQYYRDNAEQLKMMERTRRTGVTAQQYEEMIIKCRGKCELCGIDLSKTKQINVDHCHKTGQIRGILCNKCNLGLGHFYDDPELLIAAAQYLYRYLNVLGVEA